MKRILLLIAAFIFASPAAFAACTSPAGVLGSMNWGGGSFQYCDGTNWTAFSSASPASTPSAYSFTNVTGQPLNAVVTSNTITISGLGVVPVLVTASGAGSPQVSVGGGAWATSAILFNGQTLQVRQTSSTSILTARTATINVGSGTTTWSVTTVGVVPGSQTFTSSGTFTVPAFNSLTVTVKGGGSGGQGGNGASYPCGYSSCSNPGGAGGSGGNSSFNGTVFGNGGVFGANGTASGGDTNTAGAGAAAGGGGTGGCRSYGCGYSTCTTCGSNGSAGNPGGQSVKTYTPAMLTGGSSISVVVGGGGAGGAGGCYSYGCGYSSCTSCAGNGGNGTAGSVAITWN